LENIMARGAKKSARPVSGPPPNTEAAGLLIRQYAIKLYDRQDGKGVDWNVLAGALFKGSFGALDLIADEEKRRALAWRVHAGAERRATGGYAVVDDRPASEFPEGVEDSSASGMGDRALVKRAPRPPR
jgi:hypothetical protein